MIIRVGPKSYERFQLKNPYIQRELQGVNHEIKQPHRDRVAEFFAQYPPAKGKQARCFCLPGAWWAFERTLDKKLDRRVEFVGVERNYTVMDFGLKSIPGKHLLYDERQTKVRTFRGHSTDRASVVWCKASEVMGVENRHCCGKKSWRKKYRNWSHAWLDFCAPVNDEVITCCKRLEYCLDHHVDRIPVAVTFMVGREESEVHKWITAMSDDPGADKVADRARFFHAMFLANKVYDANPAGHWSYQSAGGVTMGVATFLMTLKPQRKPSDRSRSAPHEPDASSAVDGA